MDNTKYLAGISIVGLVLILGLTMSVSAMPYISIGDTTHNFTVVPGQEADISLPIMVMNASDSPVKLLQFNVTFNCSMINITNITEVNIVNVPSAPSQTEIYNKLCNNSNMPTGLGLQKAFCVYMNTSLTSNNKTNASILFVAVKNMSDSTHPDQCVLRIAFASYKNVAGDVKIGKIKMHVKGMGNYFNTNFTLPMNITIEKMGSNASANGHINVSDANIHSQARVNGLIKACRGDASQNGEIDVVDVLYIAQYTVFLRNLDNIKDCIDVSSDNEVDVTDLLYVAQSTVGVRNLNTY